MSFAVAAVSTQAPGRYTTENKLYAGVLSKSRTLGAPNFDNPPDWNLERVNESADEWR